jgi:hypothetical protein
MKIFLYAKVSDECRDMLEKMIKTCLPEAELVVYRTVDDLSQGLRQPGKDSDVAILLASNQEDLRNILSIGSLFQNIRIILLVPNKEAEIVALAHQLRPRFLTDMNTDLAEITAVLKKMLKDE